MPYSHINKLIPKELDKRIKLTDEQRTEIKNLYGTVSQRKLAETYGVSRRLIQFIGDDSKLKANKEARAKRGGSKQYYNKDESTKSIKKHRHYKQKLMLEGKLLNKL